MSFLSTAYVLLMYLCVGVLVVGLACKITRYARIPAPLKIPTTPAPITRRGVVWRMTKEVVLFTSLFKASKWTWLFGWLFHAAMLLVVLAHLRYFTEPVWVWVVLLQDLAQYAALVMIIGLAGLWARRFFVDRVRYISAPSDHLMLALLTAIAFSGLAMRTVSPVDIVGIKAFFRGIMYFDWQPMPSDPVLLLHLSLVAMLLLVFPFSKLLHAPGVFFSPTRNQVDNPREQRHVNSWAKPVDTGQSGPG